jgi:glutamate synthase domain-containing protein 3
LKLEISGDANDYVGKGLSGGKIVIRPPLASPLIPSDNTIIGNTVLYGATAGKLFANGRAGERFCVRNSGASVVVEGCGSNGCEYMTGGITIILGDIGANFGAGMTGGMAYIYDPMNKFQSLANLESIVTVPVTVTHWETQLKTLIEEHLKETKSPKAAQILNRWNEELSNFVQVCPKEMLIHISHPLAHDDGKKSA